MSNRRVCYSALSTRFFSEYASTDPKRVNVDFPGWMVDSLDREARRMGVTRQSLIKLWLADKLGEKTAASNRRS